MNIKCYSALNNVVFNLGDGHRSVKNANKSCLDYFSSTHNATGYVDELGFIHIHARTDDDGMICADDNGDIIVGIHFAHYRTVIKKLCDWLDSHKTEYSQYTHPKHSLYVCVDQTAGHLIGLSPQAKMCTCKTTMGHCYFNTETGRASLSLVECMTNDPVKQAYLAVKYDQTRKTIMFGGKRPKELTVIDPFGFIHELSTIGFTQNDTVIGRYYNADDLDEPIGDLGELLDDMWHGEPVEVEENIRCAAEAMYELLVAERDAPDE